LARRDTHGRHGSPQAVGNILARFMKTSGLKQKLRSPQIYDCWPNVAGAEAAEHSRVVGFRDCILYVEVDSAPWLQMLSTFKKKELLIGVREWMTGVRVTEIRFKVGQRADGSADSAERNLCQSKARPTPTTRATSRSYPA
jgi:predicted nucleic acid-binding Zn ribbon protein